MARSFADSLKKAKEEALCVNLCAEPMQTSVSVCAPAVAEDTLPMVAAYSGDENWIAVTNMGYDFYEEYSDEHVSTIDGNKNISLDSTQINISQESNSQYIPFQMSRYYDGFDLASTKLQFYYVNKLGHYGFDYPVNVYCTTDKLKFAWLVDSNVTMIEGSIKFEIQAIGQNSKGEQYIWKTRPNNEINILQSLAGSKFIEPDETWQEDFIARINDRVNSAQASASEARESVNTARTLANTALNASSEAKAAADSLKDGIATEVQSAIDRQVEPAIDSKINEAINTDVANLIDSKIDDSVSLINQRIAESLGGYFTKDEVVELVNNVDVSDQLDEVRKEIAALDGLAKFNVEYDGSVMKFYNGDVVMKQISISSDPSATWVSTYSAGVDAKISSAKNEVQTSLDEYKVVVDEDLRGIHAEIDDLPETLANNYYTIETTDSKFATKSELTTNLSTVGTEIDGIESIASTNKSNIATLSGKVVELEGELGKIDKSPRLTYDVAYNEDGTYKFVLYEIQNEGDSESEVRTEKASFVIQGGGSGSGAGSVLKIEYVTKTPLVATVNDKVLITYKFSGTDSGGDPILEGTATWKVGGTTVATYTVAAGEDTFDITDYVTLGTQKVMLSIEDDAGSKVTKSWTVQKIDVRLESTFNDKLTYPMGPISFDYTPYGAVSKDVYFILDGKNVGTVTTSASGIPMPFEIPAQSHGAHLLEVYMTSEINGNTVESNRIVKDIIWYDESSKIPVIGTVYQEFTARQYDATNIEYTVYDPSTETPVVEIAVDGVVVSRPTLTKATNVYSFKTADVGEHIITITCGETVKTLKANITKLDINISPVTAGLVFDFNPSGKSNSDSDRAWSQNNVSMTVSENFDWVNGGYQLDGAGDQYFCIKAGTTVSFDYKLFADDAKKNGKEFKFVFKTTNVSDSQATFLSCLDDTTGSDHIGIQMNVHEAVIYGQSDSLHLPYSEEDIIEFEFNISKNTEDIPMVMGYEDGVSTRPMVYGESHGFTQNTPKDVVIGSQSCDVHIYRFKVYNTSLTDSGILNNFIADARSAEEMINRYDRNQIYDENQNLDPDVLAAKCPWLRVYKLSAPYFTNNKSDKVPGTTIQQIYKNGDPVLDNWTCYNAMHSGQGTSSNNYGAAGRNLDFIMNKSGVEGIDPYFKLGNGDVVDKITMTRTSVPTAYLNAKVNIASSNNLTNAILANRYNEFNPYHRAFVRDEGVDITFIKDTMEFHNCVIFIQETDKDMSTHREFADNNWHFYAIGNIGDSKKTDKSRLTDMSDKYECCVEIMDVELPLSDWPTDTMYNAMGYKVDEKTGEKIYTWAKNENLGILHEKVNGEYVPTSDTEVNLEKTYYVDILEHDDFSEDFTYGWRYIYEDGTDEENAEVFDLCKQKWIELYRFVTTSSDEDFVAHIGDYFVLDSALYYYLFTTRYCMVDNRAKNSFWHYGKTGEVDTQGNPIRKWDLNWDYDNDTSLGLNNYGKQVYRYGLEDIDLDENGEEVFREMDSTFFCRIRDLFPDRLRAMYNTLESKNAWHAESFLNKCDVWQDEFPEELWRLDIKRKYIRTYGSSFINGEGDSQFLVNMANGKMKYQRRQWERSQEKYMASKYQSSVASSDNAVFRCTVPTGNPVVEPNYRLKLIPYSYMYLNVKYGTQNPIQLRAEPNVEYEIPFVGSSADIIDVYSASIIRSFGDLSSCYPATVDTSKASKIKELIIGNSTDGYDNPSMTTLTTGANYLLEKLNIENVSGLTQSLDLSVLHSLRELYADGSSIGGVTFADGGKLELAELPAVGSLTIKNLMYLSDMNISDLSKLTTMTVENCDSVDVIDLLNRSANMNRVRIVGIDWMLPDTSMLDRLLTMKGKDKNGYNTDVSVLAGSVHIPVVKQQQLRNYNAAWPDLVVSYDTLIEQYAVSFVNHDGSVLEVQYVDKGSDAVDPTTRETNPLIPIRESSVSHDYRFIGWDTSLTSVFADRTVSALYTESLRKYTIKYVSKGSVMQESVGLYGDNIPYVGSTPVYTAEETAYVYHLFNRWDRSGFIDGDKTVNAIFDRFEYTATSFDGRDLIDLSPVEIYAMNKLGIEDKIITDKDPYIITVGNDVEYDDIDSEVLISEKTLFDGTGSYIDTGIKLFDEDKDFVLAVDYQFLSGCKSGATLVQCFQGNTSQGFNLTYDGDVKLTWGTASDRTADIDKREMIVIRHKKGETGIAVYKSNLDGDSVEIVNLSKKQATVTSATLIFGASSPEDGFYENFAAGNINWAKIWYKDLGDEVCKSLAVWPHEKVTLEASGFRRYYLMDDNNNVTSQRCSFSLLASHLLGRTQKWNNTNTNAGGWATSELNKSLNTRLYSAMPVQIRSLLKKTAVISTTGAMSRDITTSGCYITVPALIELNSAYGNSSSYGDAYSNEINAVTGIAKTISYLVSPEDRKRRFDGGDYYAYWTRSPNVEYSNYIWRVDDNGNAQGITNAMGHNGSPLGVLIEISF